MVEEGGNSRDVMVFNLDLDKIDQKLSFQGKKGRWADFVAIPMRKPSPWASHIIIQDDMKSKEDRDPTARRELVGNVLVRNRKQLTTENKKTDS